MDPLTTRGQPANKYMSELCCSSEAAECMLEKCGEVPAHWRDREPAECAQNSQHPVSDKRGIKGLPASRCCMNKVVSPHYRRGLDGGNTPEAEIYNPTDKSERKTLPYESQ